MATDTPSPLAMPATWDLVASAYADEIVPMFERYAEDALTRTNVRAGMRVVDVATGPGTLAVLAAKRGAQVDALDFSDEMLSALRARLGRERIDGVTLHQGDGMALPFGDGTYDAGFSMFGLFMFSDRARGFTELLRVLRPGAPAVVTSWQSFDRSPMLHALFSVLGDLFPNLPFKETGGPLSVFAELAAEMSAAGFRDVDVVEVTHSFPAATTEEFVGSLERTCAPLALLRHKLGEGWQPIRQRLYDRFIERVGNGPHEVAMPAWLGTGVR